MRHACWTIEYNEEKGRHRVVRVTREMEANNPNWWFACAETYDSFLEAVVNRKRMDSIMWEAEDYNMDYISALEAEL
jgi:hypothetical protein